jgi:hypothetical protein
MDATVMARRAVRRMPPAKVAALTGSGDARLAQELMRQTIQALGLAHGLSRSERQERLAAAEAALAGLRPQETLEGILATQLIATHSAAMACLTRAADEDVDDATAQAALRRAERLLAVYARQCDSLLRVRQAKPRAEPREGLAIDARSFAPAPWMEMLTDDAKAWLNGQLAEAARLGTLVPEQKRLEAK